MKKTAYSVILEPTRGGDQLFCPDFNNRKYIDGQEFVLVRPLNSERLNWMNLGSLRKVKSTTK